MEETNRKLLTRFLDNQCTQQELRQVKVLLEQSSGIELLHQLMQERDDQKELTDASIDEEVAAKMEAWQERINQRILASPQIRPVNDEAGGGFRTWQFLRHAALWISVVGIGFLIYLVAVENTKVPATPELAAASDIQQVVTKKGQRTVVRLSDSSIIHLGPESSIRFARQFNREKSRDIELMGEAFFEVYPDKEKPFVIRSGEMETRVLGTSFKVEAFPYRPYSVKVATGKVRVSRTATDSLESLAVLTYGQALSFERKTGSQNRFMVNTADLTAWKEGRTLFEDISIDQLAGEMERWYDVDVQINDSEISAYRITIALSWKDPLEKSLKVIKEIAHFNYSIEGRKITLSR